MLAYAYAAIDTLSADYKQMSKLARETLDLNNLVIAAYQRSEGEIIYNAWAYTLLLFAVHGDHPYPNSLRALQSTAYQES